MSTKLYYSRSTASLVVHWLLIELGIPHELHELDFDKRDQKSDEYLKLNPYGKVPTLVAEGGFVLFESAAIAMFIADRHPAAKLAPGPDDGNPDTPIEMVGRITGDLEFAAGADQISVEVVLAPQA